MPRYELPGPDLGVRTTARVGSEGRPLGSCSSALFLCPDRTGFPLSNHIYKAAALSAARTFSLRSKVLIERCGGAFGARTAVFVKTAQKLSGETAFLMERAGRRSFFRSNILLPSFKFYKPKNDESPKSGNLLRIYRAALQRPFRRRSAPDTPHAPRPARRPPRPEPAPFRPGARTDGPLARALRPPPDRLPAGVRLPRHDRHLPRLCRCRSALAPAFPPSCPQHPAVRLPHLSAALHGARKPLPGRQSVCPDR